MGTAAQPEITMPPSLNATLPVAVPELPVTTAVNVTDCPKLEGFADDPTVVVEVESASGNTTESIQARSAQLGGGTGDVENAHGKVMRFLNLQRRVCVPAETGWVRVSQPVSPPADENTTTPSIMNSRFANDVPSEETRYAKLTFPATNVDVYSRSELTYSS